MAVKCIRLALKLVFTFVNACVSECAFDVKAYFITNHIIIYNYFIIEKNHRFFFLKPVWRSECAYQVFARDSKRNVQLEPFWKRMNRGKTDQIAHTTNVFSAVFVNAYTVCALHFDVMGCVRCLLFRVLMLSLEFMKMLIVLRPFNAISIEFNFLSSSSSLHSLKGAQLTFKRPSTFNVELPMEGRKKPTVSKKSLRWNVVAQVAGWLGG